MTKLGRHSLRPCTVHYTTVHHCHILHFDIAYVLMVPHVKPEVRGQLAREEPNPIAFAKHCLNLTHPVVSWMLLLSITDSIWVATLHRYLHRFQTHENSTLHETMAAVLVCHGTSNARRLHTL